MNSIKFSYILCDFPLAELEAYPYVDELPTFLRKKIRARGPFLISVLDKLKLEFPAQWIFTDKGYGRRTALGIIKDMATYHV